MIQGIATYIPTKTLSNDELCADLGRWDPEEVYQKTGIKQRVVAGKAETALDMGVEACGNLFRKLGGVPEVDYILFCTQFPDHSFPPNAALLQARLNLPESLGAFDFNLACSGYVYGLHMAKSMLAAGTAKNVLLVTADTYTHHIAKDDAVCRPIFGDAASATLLCHDSSAKLDHFTLGTSGEHGMRLSCSDYGEKAYLDLIDKGNPKGISMQGPDIFNFTLQVVPPAIRSTLESAKLEVGDIDYFVLHQANAFMLEHLRRRIKVDKEHFVVDMEKTGNTVSSSIPIVLEKMIAAGDIVSGKRIVLCGFGVGFSWGACVVEF
ncbi:MAG: ketoacyl-ACP synthase III [Opitutales bacterium]|nr:ketoacyl-ACP synthase III [Opitutales bacterium]